MSGPTTAEDDYAGDFLDSLFPRLDRAALIGPRDEEEAPAAPTGGERRKTMKNSTSGGDIVSVLLGIRNQIKLYHWQTKSFADHKATDDLTAALDTAIDTFVEVYMGKYGRPKVSKSIKLHNFSSNMVRQFVEKQTMYLLTILPRKLKKTDTDLLNIRDEILAELNKIRYLFTLH